MFHRLKEGGLFTGSEPVEDAGERVGGAVEPLPDESALSGRHLDERAPAVGGVGIPVDEACPVQVGEHAADGRQAELEPGGDLADSERTTAQLLERGHMPGA